MPSPKRDFTRVKNFPGTHGNSFDVALHIADFIQSLPVPVFAALLALLAAPPGLLYRSWAVWLGLWAFLLLDWALLALLPRRGLSYGPANPPTLVLGVMRVVVGLLPPLLSFPLQAIGTLLVLYGFWVEPHRLGLTRQTLHSPKLTNTRPLKLLHLGDLHAEIGVTARERELIRQVQATQPDLILFSGDFLNLSYLHDQRAWAAAREVLAALHAPLGVFAVSGSPAVDLPEIVPQVLAGLDNIRWLQDEVITVRHDDAQIDIVGLTCTHKPFVDGPRLNDVLAQARGPAPAAPLPFTILLYHTPDLAPEAADAGVDLQLSGHTHGGQVRLPLYGALFAASLYGKRFEVGRLNEGLLTLYVTRGIGMEGKGAPRVRFLAPPEIILWELSAGPAPTA
jgi:predicted MPP superfamily phosphohydrolase